MKKIVLLLIAILLIPMGTFADGDIFWLEIEAESVQIQSPMVAVASSIASGGYYINAPKGTSVNTAEGSLGATYSINIPADGAYGIWFRIIAKTSGNDSLFLKIDDSPDGFELMSLPICSSWTWVNIKTPILTTGTHTLYFKYREAECMFDKMVVCDKMDMMPDGISARKSIASIEKITTTLPVEHPRLLVDGIKLSEITNLSKSDLTYQNMLNELLTKANSFAVNPPAYAFTTDISDGGQRGISYSISTLAAAYKFTNNQVYLSKLINWLNGVCDYPFWGRGYTENSDLSAAHMLFGVSMAYDWCYADLPSSLKNKIVYTLYTKGSVMYSATYSTYKQYLMAQSLQNHRWIALAGLVAAANVIGECYDTKNWINRAYELYGETISLLGDDGASQEGFGYWTYGLESMLIYLDIMRDMGADLYRFPWVENTAKYGLYLSLPQKFMNSASSHFDFADSDRNNTGWVSTDALFRKLASEFSDGYSQEIGNIIDAKNLDEPRERWLNLIWYKPDIEPLPLSQMSENHYFNDKGIVVSRSNFDSDNPSVLAYIGGNYFGKKASHINQPAIDLGTAHIHPDRGQISLFGYGEWLLRDDGFSSKYTQNHNTLLVDGKGQIGEGSKWFSFTSDINNYNAEILKAELHNDTTYISSQLAGAYSESSGLSSFKRRIVYIKPNILLVFDELETSKQAELQLRFFPEPQTVSGNTFIGNSAKIAYSNILPDGGNASIQNLTIYTTRSNTLENRTAISNTKIVSGNWTVISQFIWENNQNIFPNVAITKNESSYYIKTADAVYSLDLNNDILQKEGDLSIIGFENSLLTLKNNTNTIKNQDKCNIRGVGVVWWDMLGFSAWCRGFEVFGGMLIGKICVYVAKNIVGACRVKFDFIGFFLF